MDKYKWGWDDMGTFIEDLPAWAAGDILQIDPEHDEVFGGCFMEVTDPKSWGAKGYFMIPGPPEEKGPAFYRVKFGDAVKIGVAHWVLPADEE